MVKISVTGNTPLEALFSLTAFGMHCMQNADVYAAASRRSAARKVNINANQNNPV